MTRRLLGIVLVLAMALGVFVAAPRATSADDEPLPKVIDTIPLGSEELPIDGKITLFFNQAMDQASVAGALSLSEGRIRALNWLDPATLEITPEGLERAKAYTLKLAETARSAAGIAFEGPYELGLQTIGYLEVTQVIPDNGASGIETRATITVIFNRPVIPLLTVEETLDLPSPITLEPAAEGTGEWINTSVYQFKPTQLMGGMLYTVTVNRGLTDVTGAILQNDYVTTFRTISPRAIDVRPRDDAANVQLDTVITAVFSQPMDTASVEQAFALINQAQPNVKTAVTVKPNEANTRFEFTPQNRLDYNTEYRITIDPDVAKSANGATLSEGVVSNFTTVDTPRIQYIYPQNGEFQRSAGVEIGFNVPMKLTTRQFIERVTVTPEPKLVFEPFESYNQRSFYYRFSNEPSTEYTAVINIDGLTDVYGTPLIVDPRDGRFTLSEDGKTLTIRWTTPDFYPEFDMRTGPQYSSQVDVFSAYAQQTRAFSTHRNVTHINLALYRIPRSSVIEFLTGDGGTTTDSERIRTWSTNVVNPKNVLRYDMVSLNSDGPQTPFYARGCGDAPPPRLLRGERAIVLPDDPAPVRVRFDAGLNSGVKSEMPVNTSFTIRRGPVCVDNYYWWQIASNERRYDGGWVAEGNANGYFIGVPGSNARVVRADPIAPYDENARPLQPGLYYLMGEGVSVSNDFYDDRISDFARMAVTTVNITLKASVGEFTAWVTDMKTGEPVPNLPVNFAVMYDNNTVRQLEFSVTDADGIAVMKPTFPLDNLYDRVFAWIDTPEHFSVVDFEFDDGLRSWELNLPTEYYPSDSTVYIYTDRSLYRPGQPIYFKGVVRAQDDRTYTLDNLPRSVLATVVNNRGEVIYEKTLPVSEFGSFGDKVDIAEDGPLGYYRINIYPSGRKDDRAFGRGVDVAQYRVPEFQVQLNPEANAVVQGDTVRVTVESSYFFGGAVSNASVGWSVFMEDYYFRYQGPGGYDFIDYNQDDGPGEYYERVGELVSEGSGQTDAQGRFVVEIPAELGKRTQSQTFTIEARVTDESDQLIAGRTQVIVHQGEFYIGANSQNYVGRAKEAQKINLITVNWDSSPLAGQGVSVRVVERRWKSTQTVDPETGRTVWNYNVEEIPVADGVATTDSDGKAVYEFTPERGGVYKVYATSRDSKGNTITTSTFLWVASEEYVSWRQQNSNRIDLKIDRSDYRVGDTANILITSPFQGAAKALVTVERGKIIKREVIDLPNNSTVYQLPIDAAFAPNAFVSVTIIKGVDDNNPVPSFRYGATRFSVDTERYKLNISVSADRELASPRQPVNYTIKVTDYQGEPVQAELGVGLTDLAVLSLLPDTSTPILDHFYSEAGLGVRTALTLVQSADQQTQEILNTIKGGGGGGPEGGIFEVRQRFIDTPLWLPSVITDARGEATVSVELPDQLTTWRLDVRAATKAIGELQTTLVGQTTFDLISTKPVLVRPITPRFYVVGDKSTLVAVVNNNSGQTQDVTARVEISGVKLLSPEAQTKSVEDRGRARFEWEIEVEDVEFVDVTFFAETADGQFRDAAKSAVGQGDDKTLPVLRYEAPETIGTGGSMLDGERRTEGIAVSRRFDVKEGTLAIRVDRSLAAATVDTLEVLRNFPYQCTEQTISRFLPNVATYAAFERLGLADSTLKTQADEAVSYAVQRLYNDQKSDGGWGWFIRDRSNPLVTAYALIALVEAQKAGFTINDSVIERAIRFLRNDLGSSDLGARPSAYDLNRQAFLLYALAYADAGNFSRAVNLFDRREQMNLYARAYLAMAFNLIDPRNTTYTDALISDLISRADVSATGVSWREAYHDYINWNTNTRSTAIVLKALVQIQPNNQLIPNVVRYLMLARKADSWETTQESAWSVLALTDYMEATGELQPNYTFDVTLNGEALVEGQTATPSNVRQAVKLNVAVSELLKDEVNRLTFARTQGEGALYYTTHLTVNLPANEVKAINRGLNISRTYHLASDPEKKPITEARVGDNIIVTLNITIARDMHYVVINDPFPAGAEAVDPDLATSAVGQPPELNLQNPYGRGYGWWWFSRTELRDDRAVLYATYLPKGTYTYVYTLRAGLAGEYRVIPTTGQEFYFPEVYGRGDGALFTLLPAVAGNDPTDTE
ncbi:MAG: hypothetical protein OHK0023_01050 [Anaerolineae bacterium]